MDASEIARALAARRRRTERQCVVCGRTIKGVAMRRYCSDACRSKAYRRRKRKVAPQEHDGEAR